MSDGLLWHRIQFAFTVTYHYLFPQLTMGLALLIVIFKVLALRVGEERYNEVARFWTRIFALNFAMGVVTGIPLEFQFGTNWARFSRYAGEVVGQTLAIEGVFAFVLESAFLGPVPLRREATRPARSPRGGRGSARGVVALGLLHHRRQRVHAAPGRAPRRCRRAAPPRRSSHLPLQSLGVLAVPAQHGRVRRDGVVRRLGRGRVLVAGRPSRRTTLGSACGWESSRGWSRAF